MKGIRFYAEFSATENKRDYTAKRLRMDAMGGKLRNCIAVFDPEPDIRNGGGLDAVGSIGYSINSPVASTPTCHEYIRTHCKRVSEDTARLLHPALFEYLDS